MILCLLAGGWNALTLFDRLGFLERLAGDSKDYHFRR